MFTLENGIQEKDNKVEGAAVKLMDEPSAASSTTNPMALKPELDSSDDEELESVKQEIMKSATDESNSEVKEATLRKLIRNVKKCFCICNVKDEKEEFESVGQLSNKPGALVEENSDSDEEIRGPIRDDGGGGQ